MYDQTERPTLYPESMREEAIALIYHTLSTGNNVISLQKYKKNNGEIEFGELQSVENIILADAITENVQKGYKGEIQAI